MRISVKIFLILSALCIIFISVILLLTPQVQGLELSIYDAYPPIFWLLLILLYSCGIFILINNIERTYEKNYLLVGLVIISVYYFFLIGIITFHGYPFADPQDMNVHLANINQILSTGYLNVNDIYPAIHIYSAVLHPIALLNFSDCAILFTVIIYIIFLMGIYIFSRSISNKNNKIAIISTIFASIPIFGYQSYFIPNMLSIMILPLVLFLYKKIKDISTVSLYQSTILSLIIILSAIIFFHPVTTIYIIFILFVLMISDYLLNANWKAFNENKSIRNSVRSWLIYVQLYLVLLFFLWYLNFIFIQRNLRGILLYLTKDIGGSAFDQQANLLHRSGLSILKLLELIFYKYGDLILYLLPIFLFALIFIIYKQFRRCVVHNKPLLTLVILFLATTVFASILLVIQGAEGTFERIFRVPIILSAILDGFFIILICERCGDKQKIKKFILTITVCAVIIATTLGTFNYYSSPRVAEATLQISNMEIYSVDWSLKFIPFGNDVKTTQIRGYYLQKRFISPDKWGINELFGLKNFIPTHYNYIGNSINKKVDKYSYFYMVTGKRDIIFKYFFPEESRKQLITDYTDQDNILLDYDNNKDKLYNCGEVNIWKSW